MAAQQEALQGEVLSELLITDNDEVKAQYPDDIDDTGIRKGAIIHYGSRRGVVAHDPQDECSGAFPVMRRPRCCRCMKCYWRGPPVKKQKKLEKAAKDLHDVICQSEPYKDYGDANKATLQQIRNGDAPPVWSVNDARHRSDLEWIAHICMKACAYRNLVSSLELHKQCWTSLEICVEPAITLFGRQAPEVVSLLLLQLYAFEDLYDLPNHKGLARHARRKCEDLMDVKLEGEVSLPWLSARDPSMR